MEGLQKPDAEAIFMEFANALVERLLEWAPGSLAHIVEDRREYRDNDRFPRHTTHEEPDYNWPIVAHINDPFWESDLVVNCAKQHYGQGIYPGSQWLDQALDDTMMHHLTRSYLPEPVLYAAREFGFPPDEARVLATYRLMAEAWTSPLSRYEIAVPLFGLAGTISDEELTGEAEIKDKLRVTRLTPADKNRLWTDRTDFPYLQHIDEELLGATEYQLAGSFVEELPRQFPSDDVANDIYSFLFALRFHKKGDVATPVIFRIALEPRMHNSIEAHSFLFGEGRPFGGRYLIESGDLARVRQLLERFESLEKLNAFSPIEVSVRRYMQSRIRLMPEDRLIDLTIALESCLLGTEVELAYRFPLRGAALLVRRAGCPPSRVRLLLHALYRARNKVVHDGQILRQMSHLQSLNKDDEDIDEHVDKLVEAWDELSRVILDEFQLRILSDSASAAEEGRAVKIGALVERLRLNLDDVLVDGLEVLRRDVVPDVTGGDQPA